MAELLKPLNIGSLSLHNRLVMPPMRSGFGNPDGTVNDKLLDYYDERTRRGFIGLVIVEHSYVSADKDIKGLTRLSEVLHKNGSKARKVFLH